MAPPEPGPTPLSTLNLVINRLKSTPAEQLPYIAQYLASTLTVCKTLLSTDHGNAMALSSETAVVVHRFKTHISSLLQDRSVHARWAAIVLVKSAIELGGWEALKTCGPWVKGLLGLLTKPDPPTMKSMAIIALTRIFMLSKEYPTLVREVTTPSLSQFIPSCLELVYPKALASIAQQNAAQRNLTPTVLDSFIALVPRHPTIFRTHRGRIQALLVHCLAPDGSEGAFTPVLPTATVSAARELFVQLHYTAHKNGGSEEWKMALKNAIVSTHNVADQIFRSVQEDWKSATNYQTTITTTALQQESPSGNSSDPLGLPPWTGLMAGSERLMALLNLQRQYLDSATHDVVEIPLGALVDLIRRILSLTVPRSLAKDVHNNVRPNLVVSKEERSILWTILPEIHEATLNLVLTVLRRFRAGCLPLIQSLLDDITEVFGAEKIHTNICTAVYECVNALLDIAGPSFEKPSVNLLSSIIRAASQNLLPLSDKTSVNTGLEKGQTNGASKNISPGQAQSVQGTQHPALRAAAENLLATYLSRIPSTLITQKIRADVERTAILLQIRSIVLASVLNPVQRGAHQKSSASLLPLLARQHAHDPSVEALLRPRRPVISVGKNAEGDYEVEEEVDEDDDERGETESGALEERKETESILLDHWPARSPAAADLETNQSPAAGPLDKEPLHIAKRSASGVSDPSPPSKRSRHGIAEGAMQLDVAESIAAAPGQAHPASFPTSATKQASAMATVPQVDTTPSEELSKTRTMPSGVTLERESLIPSARIAPATMSVVQGDDSDDEDWQGELHFGPDTDDESAADE